MIVEKSEAVVSLGEDLAVVKISILKSTASPPGADQIMHMRDQGDKRVIRAREVPPYYLAGVEKKLDICSSWAAPFARFAHAARADNRTTLDFDRLYTLWQAVRAVAFLDAPILEIGVLRGGSSALLASAQLTFGKKGKIYSCDTFRGHASVDSRYDAKHTVGHFGDRTSFADVKKYLKKYKMVEVREGPIEDVGPKLEEDRFALVHIDVDVYGATLASLQMFAPKVAVGGLIVVDDYGFKTCPGAKKAVDDFQSSLQDFSMMHMLTGQMLMTRFR